MSIKKNVVLYASGVCPDGQGRGGYGAVLVYGDHRKEVSLGYSYTTLTRMRLRAIIAGLHALKESCEVTIFTDIKFKHVKVGEELIIEGRQIDKQKMMSAKIMHSDLLVTILDLAIIHDISINYASNHIEYPEIERCRFLGSMSMMSDKLSVDHGAAPINKILQRAYTEARHRRDIIKRCPRCAGSGRLPWFEHIEGGKCFMCDGRGRILVI